MRKWIIIVVIVGMLGWATYDFVLNNNNTDSAIINTEVGAEAEDVGLGRGDVAPDFELMTLDGEAVKLSDFHGEKVIVNFWATWCPPCRAEMPDMQKFHADHDATILAVNLSTTEKSEKDVEQFLDEYGVTFTVLSDESNHVSTLYNASALPTSYLIDSHGEIHNKAIGALNYEMMVQAFDEMD